MKNKYRRAEKAGIRFDSDFRYGGEILVFDLGVVLNNLYDANVVTGTVTGGDSLLG